MISKKNALILGVLAIGGVAAASAVADSGGGGGGGMKGAGTRSGGIVGSQQGYGADSDPYAYVLPPEPSVVFPKTPDYTNFLKEFFASPIPQPIDAGSGRAFSTKKETLTETEAKSMGWEEGMDRPFSGFAEEPINRGTQGVSSAGKKSTKKYVSSGSVASAAQSRAGLRSFRKKIGMPAHGRSD